MKGQMPSGQYPDRLYNFLRERKASIKKSWYFPVSGSVIWSVRKVNFEFPVSQRIVFTPKSE